jgi:phosphinothricin acetyltransferase
MKDVIVRGVQPGDICDITRIYGDAVRHGTASFEIEPPDETEMARREQVLRAGRYPYLVALSAGVVVGYAYAGPYHSRAGYKWTVEDSVYIAPEFHRRGVGSLLLAALVEQAEALGFRQMVAVIADSAQAASVPLHVHAGFALVGTLRSVGFKHGRWRNTILMQRPLGDADKSPP